MPILANKLDFSVIFCYYELSEFKSSMRNFSTINIVSEFRMDFTQANLLLASLYADQTDFARAKRARLEALLLEEPQAIGIIARLLVKRSSDPLNGFDYINPNITDANFPTSSEPSIEGAELENYGKWVSSKFVSDDLAMRKRCAATPAESLAYVRAHPELRNYWIVALGQVWVGPSGLEYVVVLDEYVGKRNARLEYVAVGWLAYCSFLSLPL